MAAPHAAHGGPAAPRAASGPGAQAPDAPRGGSTGPRATPGTAEARDAAGGSTGQRVTPGVVEAGGGSAGPRVSPGPVEAPEAARGGSAGTGTGVGAPPGPVEPLAGAVARLRTVPGRIRAGAAGVLVLLALLAAVLAAGVGQARGGVGTIGHDAGPQVVVTGDLYFALSAMDAQVADILLIGGEHGLGIGYDASVRRYDRYRGLADAAAVQAAQLAGSDPGRLRTVRAVLDGLGRYERLAAQALQLADQAGYPAGRPTPEVVATYTRATDLMRLQLLPQAYNVTLDSGATVRASYESRRSAVLTDRTLVLAAGTVVLAALVAGQIYLARDFRRVLNPALVLGTVATLALVVAGAAVLSAEAGRLREAKRDGFDSVLALSRARAISHSAFADESRFLLDPERADTYEQTYLDKSLAVLDVEPAKDQPLNLATYYAGLGRQITAFTAGRGAFLGFFGDEARQERTRAGLVRTLAAYRAVQDNDRRMRALAGSGDLSGAVRLRMGTGRSGAIGAFDAYDAALGALRDQHRRVLDDAVRAADADLRGWDWIPPVTAVGVAVLVLAGVRPRLAEFR
ncbi:hypothetical protein BTM25_03460 [Actinomadura rubteroloni]|uniref:Uncharacterized protein n=1 Tax=Actinomadura rubteroloni TaxID=1926885 RepID=A0A2P4ULN9_9ACTN|nr:hypothetical protein BTM25_03460 [Actinomadura rubteroloni]